MPFSGILCYLLGFIFDRNDSLAIMKKLMEKMDNKILQRYIIFFSIVILIPLIMGSVFYNQTILFARKHIEDNNQLQIKQIEKTFSQITDEIERVGSHAIMETQLEYLFEKEINNHNSSGDQWIFLNTNELPLYSLSNKIIGEYYIFLEDSNMVYGPNYCSSLQTFWNYMYKAKEISSKSWISNYIRNKWKGDYLVELKFINNSDENYELYIPYIKSFQFKGNISGSIVFLIPETEILEQLSKISYSENGSVGIIGNNGKIISSTNRILSEEILNDLPNIENVSMLDKDTLYLTSHHILNFPGKLIISQTKKDINSQAIYISKITITFIIIVTVIGILIGFIASFITSKPLFNILKDIKKQQLDIESGEKSSSDIRDFFREITGQNRKLKNELNEHKPYIEQLFYKSLLSGELTDHEIEENIKLLDLNFDANFFTIACVDICLNDSRDGIFNQIVVREFLKSYYSETIYYHQISTTRFALICKLTKTDINNAIMESEEIFRSVKEKIELELHEKLRIGIGLACESPAGLYEALTEAKIVLKSIPRNIDDVVLFNINSKGNKINFFYNIEVENRLISYLKLGKTDELNRLLTELEIKNMNNDTQSFEVQRIFLYNLIATILKTYLETSLDNISIELRIKSLSSIKIKDFKKCYQLVKALFIDLSALIYSESDIEDIILKTKINCFIENNFRNQNLNLIMAAEEFKFSTFYFSRIFTNLFNKSFRIYVEDLRMDYVKDKLTNTDTPLKIIAFNAGYSSMNTFSKVFKRKYSYSATEFRKLIKLKN